MTVATLALARRAMASGGWHWLPGMADADGDRCERVADGVPLFRMPRHHGLVADADAVPGLGDPLTVQALLLLVREAWGMPRAFLWWDGGIWLVSVAQGQWPDRHLGRGVSEAEALVAALERAP